MRNGKVFALVLLGAVGCAQAAVAPVAVAPAKPHASPRFVSPFSYEWFLRAELLRERGQHAAAVEAYRTALASADEDAYLLARLAETLQLAGRRAEAEQALRAALSLDPASEAALLAEARIARRGGEGARALRAYERAEVAAPGSAKAPLELAEFLEAHGAGERARAVLERVAAQSDSASRSGLQARLELARARGDGDALERAARAFLDSGLRDDALLARTAAELLADRRAALAARVLAAVTPNERDAALRLQVALALGDHAAAEALLAQSAPSRLGGSLAVARVYLDLGKAESALELLQEREHAEDADPQARSLLQAEALIDLGRLAEAAEVLDTIPVASAHHPRVRELLARALETAGRNDLARGLLAIGAEEQEGGKAQGTEQE